MKKAVFISILFFYGMLLFAQVSNPETQKPGKTNFKPKALKYLDFYSDYDVIFYGIDLSATNQTAFIEGSVSIFLKANKNLDALTFEFVNEMTVDSVINSTGQLSFNHSNHLLTISLPTTLTQGNTYELTVYYYGNPTVNSSYSGLSTGLSNSWGKRATWTLSESYHAKEWFPCKEDLNDKIDSAWIFITVPSTCMAGANGLLTNVDTLAGNYKKYKWKTYYPIDYYLLSFSVSEYQDYTIYAHPAGYADSIPVKNFVYNTTNCLTYFKSFIDKTVDCIELYSDLFGLYPFADEKYGHCMAPIPGGMEHQTMTTLGWFDFQLVSHELAHQWFGDEVTCATWQDIWINEGFASYTEYIAAQNLQSQANADSWMTDCHDLVLSEPGGSVYIPFAEVNDEYRIFDYRLSYQKGAAIIHTIRYLFGNDSLFFATLKDYLQTYKDSTATGDDFKNFIETHTGIDFTDYFNEWLYGEGYPTFSITYAFDNDSMLLNILETTSTTTTPLFKIPVEYKISYSGGDTIITLNQTQNLETFKIPFSHVPTGITVDPNNWILNKTGSIVVGNKQVYHDDFEIYPNPCSDVLHIKHTKPNTVINIYNIQGKEMLKTDKEVIDISEFENGIYIIKSSGNQIIHKLVKF